MADDVEPPVDGDDGQEFNGQGTEASDRYIPTPEELEEGKAPRAPRRREEEPQAEKPGGFLGRFRMRRRRGVGRRRKYVTPKEALEEDGPQDGDRDEPGSVGTLDHDDWVSPGDDGESVVAATPPQSEDSEPNGSEPGAQPESVEGGEEPVGKNKPDSRPDDSEPTPRKVGSVSFKKPKRRKPPAKKPADVPRTSKQRRTDELYAKATAHGHSMGNLKRKSGSDNEIATCEKCQLVATLVADHEEMSRSIYWGIRGPALERQCTGAG